MWLWFAERVWCVRFSALREDWMERRCWVRNSLRVLRDSFMRWREVLSLAILKCDVHCAMSWVSLGRFVCVFGEGAYGSGVFVEKHVGLCDVA